MNENAHLLSVEKSAETEFVLGLIQPYTPRGCWIGLKAAFDWEDSLPLVYTNWAKDEPKGQTEKPCAWMYGKGEFKGLWKADKCAVEYDIGVVCKMSAK